MQGPQPVDVRFADWLWQLGEGKPPNRSALAALRRGLGKQPGTVPETYPYVVSFLPQAPRSPEDRRREWVYFVVASLYAWHPLTCKGGPDPRHNLGRSLAEYASKLTGRAPAGETSLDHRFQALLNARPEELPTRLREAIGLLRSGEIPVDWAVLIADLMNWQLPSREVQRRWARAFWGGRPREQTSEEGEGNYVA